MRGSLFVRRSIGVVLLTVLTGCATPVFKDAPPAAAAPAEIAAAPERYHGLDVVWGGKIVGVQNVDVNLDSKVVTVEFGDSVAPESIVAAIKEAGYEEVEPVAA